MAQKAIYIQSQNVQSGNISPIKPVGFISLNLDNIKITMDAYNGSGASATPRTNSLIQIIDDKDVFEMTPETLLQVVRFFQKYSEMGSDIVSFKNIFHVVMPDQYLNAQKQPKKT
jgi:hypothetical protein